MRDVVDSDIDELWRLMEKVPAPSGRGWYLIETGRSFAIRDPRHRCVSPYIREWEGCEDSARYMAACANAVPSLLAIIGQLKDKVAELEATQETRRASE